MKIPYLRHAISIYKFLKLKIPDKITKYKSKFTKLFEHDSDLRLWAKKNSNEVFFVRFLFIYEVYIGIMLLEI